MGGGLPSEEPGRFPVVICDGYKDVEHRKRKGKNNLTIIKSEKQKEKKEREKE